MCQIYGHGSSIDKHETFGFNRLGQHPISIRIFNPNPVTCLLEQSKTGSKHRCSSWASHQCNTLTGLGLNSPPPSSTGPTKNLYKIFVATLKDIGCLCPHLLESSITQNYNKIAKNYFDFLKVKNELGKVYAFETPIALFADVFEKSAYPIKPLPNYQGKKNFQICDCITLQVIIANDYEPHMFLKFFLTLAGCSLISVPATWFVNNKLKLTFCDLLTIYLQILRITNKNRTILQNHNF